MRRNQLSYLTATLSLREQSHRRATLLGIAALILLSMSPVIGHHLLPFETDDLLAGVDHLGALCLTALHLLFAPVHPTVHIAIAGGLLYAGWDRYRAWRLVRRSLGLIDIRRARPGDAFWEAAEAAGVNPRILRIVPGLPNPAFTAGMLQPRIYISQTLASYLAGAELAAVVAHEGAHVARRDPLRLTMLRGLACMLFWLPALRRLADDVGDQAELLADDVAAGDKPLVLASAILSVARWSSGPTHSGAAVGFARADLLEQRVRRLAGEATPVRSHVTRRSLLAAAMALAILWTSGVLLTHPLPAHAADAHARHCDHQHESALAHLFCRGTPFGTTSGDCPHHHV
jgi:Zn-dependent protease with chaperone function